MAKSNVRLDYDELQKLKEQIEQFGETSQVDLFLTSCAKELAARLLAKVVKRTPTGDYSRMVKVIAKRDSKKHKKGDVYLKRVNTSGKTGGTLKRGWTSKTHEEAESGSGRGADAKEYADSLPVNKVGTDYVIEIINPVKYSSYVEFGHRTRNHKGWVEGKFMLTMSENEIRNAAPRILEKKLEKYLMECFK